MTRTRRILTGLLATICLLSTAGCTSGWKDDESIPEYTRCSKQEGNLPALLAC